MKPLIISFHWGCHTNRRIIKSAVALFISVCLCAADANAQQRKYTVDNAHSHNDYLQVVPFFTAYNAGFGSIEADIFLRGNQLYVSHDTAHITTDRTLQSLYLDPLTRAIADNKGSVYKEAGKKLLLLIDIKTSAEPTLSKLVEVLNGYKSIISCSDLKVVITGNQPDLFRFDSYPSYLYFDGKFQNNYTAGQLKKVVLFSDNFATYSRWKGEGLLPDSAKIRLGNLVKKAHELNKPVRFWGAPDNTNTWVQLIRLNVDYINTDKISEIAAFLKQEP